MTNEEARQLERGIYRLHLVRGGTCLAAVGFDIDGNAWIAPCNWSSVHTPNNHYWDQIESVELEVPAQPFIDFANKVEVGNTSEKHFKIDREI